MIDIDAARQIVADHIREGETRHEGGSDGILKPSFTPIIIDSRTRELDIGWVFFYDSGEHQSSGDLRHSLVGNAPIIVDRVDGSVHPTGTAHSIDDYIEEYRRKREGK